MHPEENRGSCRSLTDPVVTLAVFFVFLELLETYRLCVWSGLSGREWYGAAMGLALYALLLGGLAWVLWLALQKVAGGRVPSSTGMPLCVAMAGLAVWIVLRIHRKEAPTLEDVLVVLALTGIILAVLLIPRLGMVSRRAVCAVIGLALVGGIAMLDASSRVYLLDPERPRMCMLASVAWTLGAACVGMLVWRGRTRILTAVLRWGFAALVVLSPLGWACVSTNLGRAPGGAEALRAPERPDKPNIILLVVDTLRADYCPARGGSCSTPALESLAQKGVLFEQCYALAPWTPPSMSGMFASAYPPGLAAGPTRKPWRDEARSYSLRPQDKSLAELLVSDGRKTCALVGNPVVSEMTSLFHGFETRADSPATVKRPSGYLRCLPLLASTLSAHIPSLKITSYNDTTIDLTRWAVAYLRSRKNAPFFLWVHYLDPHAPYDPPAAYRTMNGPWPSFAANLDDEKWFEDGDHGLPLGDFDARNRPYVRSLYEGEVRYVDDSIGRIAAELRRLGLEDNTFVCVTSDHGEEFWEHGGWGHGQTLYDELIHVPLILAGPGLSHRTVEERVSAIDLMPTLAELAGVAPAESWLGASLAPLARGEVTAPSPKPCYARATSYRVRAEPLEMVISGQYKLVRGVNTGSDEFYNIPQDPGETRNLAAEEPQRVSQLAELLDRWRAVNPPDFKTFFGGSPIESNREEALQQLRAVGYL